MEDLESLSLFLLRYSMFKTLLSSWSFTVIKKLNK